MSKFLIKALVVLPLLALACNRGENKSPGSQPSQGGFVHEKELTVQEIRDAKAAWYTAGCKDSGVPGDKVQIDERLSSGTVLQFLNKKYINKESLAVAENMKEEKLYQEQVISVTPDKLVILVTPVSGVGSGDDYRSNPRTVTCVMKDGSRSCSYEWMGHHKAVRSESTGNYTYDSKGNPIYFTSENSFLNASAIVLSKTKRVLPSTVSSTAPTAPGSTSTTSTTPPVPTKPEEAGTKEEATVLVTDSETVSFAVNYPLALQIFGRDSEDTWVSSREGKLPSIDCKIAQEGDAKSKVTSGPYRLSGEDRTIEARGIYTEIKGKITCDGREVGQGKQTTVVIVSSDIPSDSGKFCGGVSIFASSVFKKADESVVTSESLEVLKASK